MDNCFNKFCVHFRFDTRVQHHEQMLVAIEMNLSDHLLEPVRKSVWNHLMTAYFITDERGVNVAKLLNYLYDSHELIYAGPL